jgi:hypothetical protein
MSVTQRFHHVAIDALVRMRDHLYPGAKLCLAVYAECKPDLDVTLKANGISVDEVVHTLRRAGLRIDGDNTYKRDLCHLIAGDIALVYQGNNQLQSTTG